MSYSAPPSVVQTALLEFSRSPQAHLERAYLGCEVPNAKAFENIESKLAWLVRTYDVLRTRYALDARGRVRLFVESDGAYALERLPEGDAAQLRERHLQPDGERLLAVSVLEQPAFLALSLPRLSGDLTTLTKIAGFLFSPAGALPKEPVQYGDVAQWFNELATSEEAEIGRRFWASKVLQHSSVDDFGLKRYLRAPRETLSARRIELKSIAGLSSDKVSDAIRETLGHYTGALSLARVHDGRGEEPLRHALGAMSRLAPALADSTPEWPAECLIRKAGSPLFDFAFEAVACRGYRFAECQSYLEPTSIRFVLCEEDDGHALFVEWDERWIDRPGIDLLGERIVAALKGAVSEPHYAARGRALQASKTDVVRWFAGHASAEARVIDGDDSVCNHAGLHRESNRVAAYLRARGIGKGDLVALLAPRSIDFLECLLGVLKAGAAYTPLDPAYPSERLGAMLAAARPSLIFAADATHRALADAHGPAVVIGERPWADCSDLDTPIELEAVDLAYVLFTSGSTGTPKGVAISHGALLNHMAWMLEEFAFTPRDVFLQRTSLSFDASVWEVWAPLLVGADLVLAPEGINRDAGLFLRTLRERAITVLQMVPSLFTAIAGADELKDCRSLRYLFFGGEALPRHVAAAVRDALGCEVINLYGPTECCIDALFWRFSNELTTATAPIGRPIANTQCLVIDRDGKPVQPGEQGQLCIGGAGVFNGYLHRPDLTAQAMFFHEPEQRHYYKSGDWVQIAADGVLHFRERIDDQIKLNGYRIELAEIAHVAREVSGARDAVCLFDAGLKRLLVFVVDPKCPAGDIQRLMAEKLPAHMAPEFVMPLDALPLNANGKLDKRALLSRHASQALSSYVAPQTRLEGQLADIWKTVLGSDRPVGVLESFFARGGDSIKSIKASYLAARQGIVFSSLELFRMPRIRDLAAHIESRTDARTGTSEPMRIDVPAELAARFEDIYPTTPMQQYMLQQYDLDIRRAGAFHPQQLKYIDAAFDLDALQAAIETCLQAVNFRTRFVECHGTLLQAVRAGNPVRIERSAAVSHGEISGRVRQAMEEDRLRPFNWRDVEEPLVRMQIFPIREGGVVILMSNIHPIQDGWGNTQFFEQVLRQYRHQPRAESPNVSKEFALQHERRSQDDARMFWQQYPKHAGEPQDRAVPQQYAFELPPRELHRLEEAASRLHLPMKSIVLSIVSASLVEWGGDSYATAGVVWNGRNEELSDPFGAQGLFWYLVPFAVSRHPDPESHARLTHQETLRIEPHASFPLLEIVRMNGGRQPFRWTFNYTDFRDAGWRRLIGAESSAFDVELPPSRDYFGFPLELSVHASVDGLAVMVTCQPGILGAAEVDALHARISAIARGLTTPLESQVCHVS